MLQLWRCEQELRKRNIFVYVVTFDDVEMAQDYENQSPWTWPLLLDPDLELYRRFSRGHASWWALAGPVSIVKYVRWLINGSKLQKVGKDIFQLGADVVANPDGEVVFHNLSKDPHDRPDVQSVLKTVFET